jgi:hypothetical protein
MVLKYTSGWISFLKIEYKNVLKFSVCHATLYGERV